MSYFPHGSRNNNLIDVNQNSNLLSSSYRVSGNQHAFELEEQIRSYKRELAKKDDLIAQLSSRSPRHDRTDLTDPLRMSNGMDNTFNYLSRNNCSGLDNSQAELAASKIKIENLLTELRELQSQLRMKDNYVQELKSKYQLVSETSARQEAIIQNLKEHAKEADVHTGVFDDITTKGCVTIQTLQRENREAREKIIDLEARLRNHVLNKEEGELEADTYRRRYYDVITKIGDAFNTDTEGGHMENAIEVLVEKAKLTVQEQLLLQTKVQTLDDALCAHNLEAKASRETITRLMSEVGKEQKGISEVSNNVERLKRDREDLEREKESIGRELELYKERLTANEKAWTSSREELTQAMSKASLLNEDVKRLEHEKNLIRTEFDMFRESIAKNLSDPYFEIPAREESIKDRIKELAASEREKKARINCLEAKVLELSNELERQCELHHDSIRRAKKAESFAMQKESCMSTLERQIASDDVMRESLRNDKSKYVAFMQQMADALRMREIPRDCYDLNTDVLITRAHQLARLENDELVEKSSSNCNLMKKIRSLKDQLKSKQLHMELLRRKIAQFEEKEQTRGALAIDRDDAIVTVQRLHRKVERLQHALGDEKVKVTQLKAQLAETNQLKAFTLEQRNKIDHLVENVSKLSTVKERQRMKLSNLKRDLSSCEQGAGENESRLRSQLDAITNDLRSTKTVLDEVQRREKQLVDFREVVARMLGLDVTCLAIPDYEVISRLEKLIRNHHIGTASNYVLDRSLENMSSQFRAGYEKPRSRSPCPPRYHTPNPPSSDSCKDFSPRRYRQRTRSLSPKRY